MPKHFLVLQVAEEEYLLQELRKIEARKKEREKRSQDLQKLITAADTTAEQRRTERKAPKKKLPQKKEAEKPVWRLTSIWRLSGTASSGHSESTFSQWVPGPLPVTP